MSELGAFLQRHREERGLSIQEVEQVTRIRARYLEAMEGGNWDDLPPGVYTRGLLKIYARALGVSVPSVMRMYVKERPGEARLPEPKLISRPLVNEPRVSFDTVLAAIVLLVAAGLFGWMIATEMWPRIEELRAPSPAGSATVAAAADAGATATDSMLADPVPDGRPTEPPLDPPPVRPADTSTPRPSPTPSGLRLEVSAGEADAWIRVRGDGEEIYQGFLRAGESQDYEADERVALMTGNAGDTLVTLNGREVGPLGERGAVMEFEWTLGGSGQIVQRDLRAPPGAQEPQDISSNGSDEESGSGG